MKMNMLTVVLMVTGLNQRIYGYSNLRPHLVKMLINSICIIVGFPFYIYVNQAVINLSDNHNIEVTNMMQEVKVAKEISNEYQEMLENLEEAIVVAKKKTISFSNSLFDKVL